MSRPGGKGCCKRLSGNVNLKGNLQRRVIRESIQNLKLTKSVLRVYREHTRFSSPAAHRSSILSLNVCTPGQNTRPRRNSMKKTERQTLYDEFTEKHAHDDSVSVVSFVFSLVIKLLLSEEKRKEKLCERCVRFTIMTRLVLSISSIDESSSCRFFRSLMIPNGRFAVVDKRLERSGYARYLVSTRKSTFTHSRSVSLEACNVYLVTRANNIPRRDCNCFSRVSSRAVVSITLDRAPLCSASGSFNWSWLNYTRTRDELFLPVPTPLRVDTRSRSLVLAFPDFFRGLKKKNVSLLKE